ncbi:MAG TPA: NUDIX domain-containing protein [Bacteroidales bacterium]|nr:NUDIX domain-containing protein [Bacteroidales bacterium]
MAKQSAGILLYRLTEKGPEFFLVHPGGPFWAKKDSHAWSIPKGEFTAEEDPLEAAKREFEEETGNKISADFIKLRPIKQKGGKEVFCFACEENFDPSSLKSNTFEIEWPPRSGKRQSFPEVDKGEWFDALTAKTRINEYQIAFIDEVLTKIHLK